MPSTHSASSREHDDRRNQSTGTGARPDLDDGQPDNPADLSKPSRMAVLRRVRGEYKNDNLTDLAAGLTYYGVLSIVPGLIVVVSGLGLAGKDITDKVVNQVQSIAPGSSASVVHTLLTQAQSNRGGAGIGAILGIVVALWSASGYVAAFMRASNVIYSIGEGRPIWKTVPIRLAVTVVTVILLVISAVIVVVSGPIARQVGDLIGAGHTAILVWDIVKWPVLLILVSLLLAILFWAAPNAMQGGIQWISPGGIIATLIWVVISALFAVYVTNFSSYNKTYGALAGVVIFLVWLWLTNIALLLGAEVNAELDHGRAIAEGLPEDVQPFAEPRDTHKLDDADKRAVDEAQSNRHR